MIISVVNQKGGVGKTTLAVNLADFLARETHRPVLIDADPQGSVLQWQAITQNASFQVAHQTSRGLEALVSQSKTRFKPILIDSPPALGGPLRDILGLTDLAVVPIGPSPLDIWSSKETIGFIREEQQTNPGLRGFVLICKKIPGTRLGAEAAEALSCFELPLLRSELSLRIAFVQAMVAGVSVLEYAPNSEAAAEIRNLGLEIKSLMA